MVQRLTAARAFGAAGILPHAERAVNKKDREQIQGVAYSNFAVSFFLCARATWVILSPCSTVERRLDGWTSRTCVIAVRSLWTTTTLRCAAIVSMIRMMTATATFAIPTTTTKDRIKKVVDSGSESW